MTKSPTSATLPELESAKLLLEKGSKDVAANATFKALVE